MATAIIVVVIVLAMVAALAVLVLRYQARHGMLMRRHGSEETVRRIMDQEVWRGMTEEQLLQSVGRPTALEEKRLKTKLVRIYKYEPLGRNRFRVKIRLDDGIVTGWDQG